MNCNIINYIILVFFIICSVCLSGQVESSDTLPQDSIEQAQLIQDSTLTTFTEVTDSLKIGNSQDSIPQLDSQDANANYQSSQDALDIQVSYGALDTQWYDHKLKQMHLFGEAYVNYGTMNLTAGYIIFDIESNEARAYSIEDTEGHEVQKPTFKDGNQEFTYDQLRYNFETNKGIVNQAVTQFTDLFVLGAKTKFVGGEEVDGEVEDVIYNSNALITSCTHDEPHYGIRAKKLKVIPNKIGVTGPARLELGGVPTPLWLPFGFFPLSDGRSAGIKFPKNFPYQADLGFGIQGVGYYLPINDYMDLELTADYYTRGTWGFNTRYRYKLRYRYNGYFDFNFRNTKNEVILTDDDTEVRSLTKVSNKSLALNLSHNQDSKAHPYRTFGGSINFTTSDHYSNTENDFQNVFNNQYGSNFYFKHTMPRTPFSLDVGLSHRQNNTTSTLDVTLPDVALSMRTIQPFKRKKAVGDQRWYEMINISGNTKMKNFVETTDSTVFTKETFENMRSGIQHDYNANVSFNVLKYFTVSPRINYDESWVFNTQDQEYFATEDSIATTVNYGFDTYRTWNTGVDVNTTLFGTILSDKGWFRGIRHTMKPRVGYSIDPDFASRYEEDIVFQGETVASFSRFDNGAFGTPNFTTEAQSITYGIGNIVELKYYSKRLEEEKKVKLLTNLNIGGSYNFAADSLNWSTVNVSGNTTLLKGFSNLRFSMTLDPYKQEGKATINELVSTDQFIPVRLARGNITLSSGVSIKTLSEVFTGGEEGKPPPRSNKKGSSRKSTKTKEISDGVYQSGAIDSTLVDPTHIQPDSTLIADSLAIGSQDSIEVDEVPYFPLPGEEVDEDGEPKEDKKWGSNQKQVDYEARAPTWIELLGNFNISHQLVYNVTSEDNRDSLFLATHTLGVRGNLNITDNWAINIGNIGYDFKNKSITYPYLGFTRKLHCWNLTFDWAPNRDAFGFFIGVNTGTLDFLKYNYGQNNIQNGFSGFR